MLQHALLYLLCLVMTAHGQQCYGSQNDFKAMCTTKYNGTMDGSRCFFVGPPSVGQDIWKSCQSSDATVAQVQTSREYNKLQSFLKVRDILSIWVAASSKTVSTGRPCGWTSDIFWQTDATTYDPLMTVDKTWSKNFTSTCLEDSYGGEQCGFLSTKDELLGDHFCTNEFPVLCQVSNDKQQFYSVKDVCVGEQPVEQLSGSNPMDCGAECAKRVWCRSFNIINDDTCELFTWSVDDAPALKTVTQSCVHYTYAP